MSRGEVRIRGAFRRYRAWSLLTINRDISRARVTSTQLEEA